jgi:acyl-CoA reductase-like NAD-dependent aldehyde dehydrogenase
MSTFQDQPGAVCPADGTELLTVTFAAPGDVQPIVERARKAQKEWAALSLAERTTRVRTIASTLLDRADAISEVLARETGRSILAARFPEVAIATDYARMATKVAAIALAPEKIKLSSIDMPGKRGVIEQIPRGVVGIIAPWNYPLLQLYKPLFPALLAGNCVVIKPSEHTPHSAAWLGALCDEVLGAGVVTVVQGDGAIGATLIDSGIDALTFTGSVATGRRVAAAAAERLIPCSLELGGKDAALVLDLGLVDRTVSGITYSAFHNAGQDCAAIEVVYVVGDIADTLVARLAHAASVLRVGNEPLSEVAPLQNAQQLATVEAHIADAKAKGATIVVGGQRIGAGFGYEPTVLDHCNDTMLAVTEETFGPVVAIVRVATEAEAITRANQSRYGLNGSVWTGDVAKGERTARQLDVGIAHVNGHGWTGSQAHIPWTGTKLTGPGVAASRHSYGTFVRPRVVMVDKTAKAEPFWYPFDDNMDAFSLALVDRSRGSIAALFRLIGLLGKRVRATTDIGKSKE